MSGFKGTPGEWAVEEHRIIANGCHIASIWPEAVSEDLMDGECWLDMRERTEHARSAAEARKKANTHLCAAAPNLLKALQRAIAWCEEHGDTRHQWYADAKKAEAKSLGDQHD